MSTSTSTIAPVDAGQAHRPGAGERHWNAARRWVTSAGRAGRTSTPTTSNRRSGACSSWAASQRWASMRSRRCLATVTASTGMAEADAPAGLHLAEDQGVALAGDDVELTLAAAPVAVEHAQAGVGQIGGGDVLAEGAELEWWWTRVDPRPGRQRRPGPGGSCGRNGAAVDDSAGQPGQGEARDPRRRRDRTGREPRRAPPAGDRRTGARHGPRPGRRGRPGRHRRRAGGRRSGGTRRRSTPHCDGVTAVVATANAVAPIRRGDSAAVVDAGYAELVASGRRSGVSRFVLASVPVTALDEHGAGRPHEAAHRAAARRVRPVLARRCGCHRSARSGWPSSAASCRCGARSGRRSAARTRRSAASGGSPAARSSGTG